MGRRGDGRSGPQKQEIHFIKVTGSGVRGCSTIRASVVGGWGGPPLQCQSRPSIAAKKRVNRRKTQIRDKTIEKYTSISSDRGRGERRKRGLWHSAVVRGMWRSQGGAALFLMGLSHPPSDQDHLKRKNLKQKKIK